MGANVRGIERGPKCCHLTPSAGEPEAVGVVGHLVEIGEAVGVDDGVAGVVVVGEPLGAVGAALLPVVVEAEQGCEGGCTGGCDGRCDVRTVGMGGGGKWAVGWRVEGGCGGWRVGGGWAVDVVGVRWQC